MCSYFTNQLIINIFKITMHRLFQNYMETTTSPEVRRRNGVGSNILGGKVPGIRRNTVHFPGKTGSNCYSTIAISLITSIFAAVFGSI